MDWIELDDAQKRQYIDAESVFTACEAARKEAASVRGSMFWREIGGKTRLIRSSAPGGHKSLGVESDETRAMYERFVARKTEAETRFRALKKQLEVQQRLNRAVRVGRVPQVVVDILRVLGEAGLQEHFLTIGTNALYAYEAACGVRIDAAATATRDMDLLFDTQKRVSFFTQMQRLDSSLLAVFRKVDKSFTVNPLQKETAVNDQGFEIDIVRRTPRDGDPHPLRMSEDLDDLYAVQIPSGQQLAYSTRFDAVVVSASGTMARMHTIGPLDFARIKRAVSARKDRDPYKRTKDKRQAEIVEKLVEEYLPHLKPPTAKTAASAKRAR